MALGPPPAPIIREVAGDLVQDAQGLADIGGLCRLYSGPTIDGPWELAGELPWDISLDWGALSFFPQEWLRATEVGNGVAYTGESEYSNAYDNS